MSLGFILGVLFMLIVNLIAQQLNEIKDNKYQENLLKAKAVIKTQLANSWKRRAKQLEKNSKSKTSSSK